MEGRLSSAMRRNVLLIGMPAAILCVDTEGDSLSDHHEPGWFCGTRRE